MQGMFVCISRGLAIKLILFIKGMEGEADANNGNQITAGELHAYVEWNLVQQSTGSQTPELEGVFRWVGLPVSQLGNSAFVAKLNLFICHQSSSHVI